MANQVKIWASSLLVYFFNLVAVSMLGSQTVMLPFYIALSFVLYIVSIKIFGLYTGSQLEKIMALLLPKRYFRTRRVLKIMLSR